MAAHDWFFGCVQCTRTCVHPCAPRAAVVLDRVDQAAARVAEARTLRHFDALPPLQQSPSDFTVIGMESLLPVLVVEGRT